MFDLLRGAILRWAAASGRLRIVRYFYEHGLCRHDDAEIMLKCAAAKGHVDVVRYLHEHGANLKACETGAIQQAIAAGHWSVLRYLFHHGCKVTSDTLKASRAKPDVKPSSWLSVFNEDARVLAAARRNFEASINHRSTQALPDAGPRWKTYAQWGRAVIPYFKRPINVIRFAQDALGHGGFESRQKGDDLAVYADALERHLMERFPGLKDKFVSFTESKSSDPETTLAFNGRPVSGPMYANMTFFLECVTHIPPPVSVCEIGGGYGGPSRLWLTNAIHRPHIYVIVDLPESLFFSEVFLRTELGFENVNYINSEQPIDLATADKFTVLLCPVSLIAALRNLDFDLVFNTLSMQEMSESYIDFYMNWLDQQPCHYFYSFNYAAQPLDEHPESMNKCSLRLSARWHPVWIEPYAERPSPAMHVLAEKQADETIEATRQRGQALFDVFISKPCDSVTFMYLLMAAKLCGDPLLTYTIVAKVSDEMSYLPRELLVLLDLLEERQQLAALSPEQQTKIDAVAAAMQQQRRAEGRVSPHLAALRERLLSEPSLS